ncbi:MAG: hypothetical protein J6J39_05425 [Clostridia bacterium]|nr:hypothetical protein [Clostridia bacterium]
MSDQFSKIAEGFYIDESRGLITPQPIKVAEKKVNMEKGDKFAFTPFKKPSTKKELDERVKQLRAEYAPFLVNNSPKISPIEKSIEITDFIFKDYLGKESRVTLPHYGGPAENCRVEYSSEFNLDDFSDKNVYICFKGADYIAQVFINEIFVGQHEGFFAPFEFDITRAAVKGKNTLKVILQNDITMKDGGEKVYAATGLGWDDAQKGWHHCPPGVGLYNRVSVEIREHWHITDIFPCFNSEKGEFRIECNTDLYDKKDVSFLYSVHGKNFSETVIEDCEFIPTTKIAAGVSDTFTEASLKAQGRLGAAEPLKMMHGFNRFIIPFEIKNAKIWQTDKPYLYTVTIKMVIDGRIVSVKQRNFGIRTFTQDLESKPKGKFYLNGKEIKLFGANTMGFEQQDIYKGNFEQLIEDILLAKICNMNFLRITQRPVQEEFYDYCDMLGLLIQTDLPLFGVIRINKFNECLNQVRDMERLVRSHPCCVVDSYINEPFPNANNAPHRMITRDNLMNFFTMADMIVKMENPHRVIKHIDGDYDPPNELLPDNHCYTMWYNGHGIDMGMLHKGYWLGIKPDWHCGCGEFGSEGLEDLSVMRKYYPKEWLREPFDPLNIISAQTGSFFGFFYERPKTIEEWIERSQQHQSFATEVMTSSFRRNPLMNTFALHLFIDAFPSGWMKTIMDCDRNPKKAFFTYMDCLSPVYCNLRSDRFTFFDNEKISIEAYLCNETDEEITEIRYFAKMDEKVIASAVTQPLDGVSQGKIEFAVPNVNDRTNLQVYMGAFSGERLVHYAKAEYTVFPYEELKKPLFVSFDEYKNNRRMYDTAVNEGKTLLISALNEGEYDIAGKNIRVTACRMSPIYAVSRDSGHPATEGLEPDDLAYCYDSVRDRLAPLIFATFEAEDITPVILSCNRINSSHFTPQYACGTYNVGKGKVVICQLDLDNKEKNPAVVKLLNNLANI